MTSYIPASYHYVVSVGPIDYIVELGQPEDQIRVDGIAIGRQVAEGSCRTPECIRIALRHVEPDTNWSEGGEAWDEVEYEGRDGALSATLPEGAIGETAEDWYDALGYSTGEDGDYAHPVCPMAEVAKFEPELESANDAESEALRDLHTYAVAAREAALSIRASIDEAIEAWRARDVAAVLSALTDAYRAECEYGDEPSTQAATRALLGDGWTTHYRSGSLVLGRKSA